LISGDQKIALGDVIQIAAPKNLVEDAPLEEQNNTLINGGK